MNKLDRDRIENKSDEQLKADIDLYSRILNNTGRLLKSVRISQAKRLNAHIDEYIARLEKNPESELTPEQIEQQQFEQENRDASHEQLRGEQFQDRLDMFRREY